MSYQIVIKAYHIAPITGLLGWNGDFLKALVHFKDIRVLDALTRETNLFTHLPVLVDPLLAMVRVHGLTYTLMNCNYYTWFVLNGRSNDEQH